MINDNLQRKICQIRQEERGTVVMDLRHQIFTGIQIILEGTSQFA